MTPKIVDYMTIDAAPEDLTSAVAKYIQEGWQPFGGVSVTTYDMHLHCVQALVKYAESIEE